MILIAGATGFLGGEIARRLAAQGRRVRGLVRATSDPAAVERLKNAGVKTVEGDLRDPASLEGACRGVTTVISTATVTRTRQSGETIESTDQQGQLNLIDAAEEAGVAQFIYVSYSGQLGTDDPLTTAKRAVEHRVRESGMTWTILRPSVFMEVWLSPALGFDFPNFRATIYGSGEPPISWVSLSDVASFAVRALDNPAAENATIEIGGPEAVSPNDVVRVFEEMSGHPFDVQRVPEEALRAQAEAAAAAGDSLQRAFSALMLAYAKGDEIPMSETLQRFPVTLTSVRDYARAMVGAAVPEARERTTEPPAAEAGVSR